MIHLVTSERQQFLYQKWCTLAWFVFTKTLQFGIYTELDESSVVFIHHEKFIFRTFLGKFQNFITFHLPVMQ